MTISQESEKTGTLKKEINIENNALESRWKELMNKTQSWFSKEIIT